MFIGTCICVDRAGKMRRIPTYMGMNGDTRTRHACMDLVKSIDQDACHEAIDMLVYGGTRAINKTEL